MFQNKIVNIVISVVCAIAIWAYVVGNVDPSTTKTISDIPITYTGTEVLAKNGLAYLQGEDLTVSVQLSGTRSNIKPAKVKDCKATVDLSQCTFGSNNVNITIDLPKHTRMKDVNRTSVTVDIVKAKEKEFPIVAQVTGLDEYEEEGNVYLSQDSVVLTGSAEQLKKIKKVYAVLDASKNQDTAVSGEVKLKAVDKNGEKVSYVHPKEEGITGKATIYKVKTVPLSVNVVGEAVAVVTATEIPDSIKIKGFSEDIEDVSQISAEDVDLSKVSTSKSIKLKINLPDGVYLSKEYKNLAVKILVEE